MFHYSICTVPDEEIFFKQCEALEKNIKGLKKEKLLVDVDDSKIQIYYYRDKEIKVLNDYYVGALYIDAEIDLEPFFKKK
jgi:hypothetical protein